MQITYEFKDGSLIIRVVLMGGDDQGDFVIDQDSISIPCHDIVVAAGLVD